MVASLSVGSGFERIVLPYVRNLRRLGIDARVRVVDSSQYINRLRTFDFDMIVAVWPQSTSPGNEQRDFWGSAAAKTPGTRNYAGIASPAVALRRPGPGTTMHAPTFPDARA